MNLNKTEVVVDHSPLKRERWEFWLNIDYGRSRLVLDNYRLEMRESTRKRKWEAHKIYSRIGDTRSLRMGVKMDASEVPLPNPVVVDAKRQICNAINAMEVERSIR